MFHVTSVFNSFGPFNCRCEAEKFRKQKAKDSGFIWTVIDSRNWDDIPEEEKQILRPINCQCGKKLSEVI